MGYTCFSSNIILNLFQDLMCFLKSYVLGVMG